MTAATPNLFYSRRVSLACLAGLIGKKRNLHLPPRNTFLPVPHKNPFVEERGNRSEIGVECRLAGYHFDEK